MAVFSFFTIANAATEDQSVCSYKISPMGWDISASQCKVNEVACNPQPVEQCGADCIDRIQGKLEEFRNKYHVPAMQVTISFGNKNKNNPKEFIYQTFCSGTTTTKVGAPKIDKNSLFEIGSCTKSFTAAIVLKLIEESKLKPDNIQKLTIDDAIDKWLPNEYPLWKSITIRQLLHHTAGTFSYTDDEFIAEEKKIYQETGLPRILLIMDIKKGLIVSRTMRTNIVPRNLVMVIVIQTLIISYLKGLLRRLLGNLLKILWTNYLIVCSTN
jgi:CubicO group peptidase (beta-lactamase class C family)